MQMSEAGEVVQVVGVGNANTKLQEGWTLLAVVPGQAGGSDGQSTVVYVLGKPRDNHSLGIMPPGRLRN